MAMKALINAEEFAGLAEPLQKEYKQDGDSYKLDVIKAGDLELADVGKLQRALTSERGLKKKAEDALKGFGEFTPEQVQDFATKVEEMKDWTPKDKLEKSLELHKQQLTTQFQKEKGNLEGENKDLAGQLSEVLVTNAALAAINKAKGSARLLLPHVQAHTRMRKDDKSKKYIAEVIDENGDVRVGDSNGTPMTIEQLVDEMRGHDDFARAFDGTVATGSGASTSSSTTVKPANSGPVKTVAWGDQKALNSNIDDIASGKVVVKSE